MSGSSAAKGGKTKHQDVAWDHGKPLDGYPNGAECNYCRQQMKSGGVTRLKEHLAGGFKNVRDCPKVPPDVRKQMKRVLSAGISFRESRKQYEKNISERLHGFSDAVNVDDDDEEEEEENEAEMRRAMHASRAEQWEREQMIEAERSRPTFQRSTRETGGGSGGGAKGGITGYFGRSKSVKMAEPKLYGQVGGVQKKIKQMFNKGKDSVSQLGRFGSKFFFYNAIPAHAADTVAFKNFVVVAQREGEHVKPPTGKEIYGKYLKEEVAEINEWINSQKHHWDTYGVTIMCDGWTGPTRMSIINFMVYCRGISTFIKSVDASAHIKDAYYIEGELEKMIEWVGADRVVQIVTDNGTAYKRAGKTLEERYPFYWTPCAAHCIDLMLEDIGRRPAVQKTIAHARTVTKFLYNHSWVLSMFHRTSGYEREIVRPGKTRFATNYIALDSLQKAHQALTTAFNSDEWHASRYRKMPEGKRAGDIIMTAAFWDRVRWVVGILEPIYRVLRTVDSETYPSMGSMYESIHFMMRAIKENNPKGVDWVLQIIETRWEGMLSHPLHAAAYYLNPKYHYERRLGQDAQLGTSVFKVFEKLFPNNPNAGDLVNELMYFQDARGLFGMNVAIQSRSKAMPCEWWNCYGTETPNLRMLACRVLSQTVSSSPCERNWSTFALIHTCRRNRLGYQRLQDLVFCHYNMRLRERLIRSEENAPEDPLDLMMIGHYAHLEQDDDREDPLYEWLRSNDLDTEDGRPEPAIAMRASEEGLNVRRILEEERTSIDDFDPLTRSASISQSQDPSNPSQILSSTESSSRTKSGSGGGDDDDHGGGGHMGGTSGSQRPLSPFTEEADFQHTTQDDDHGARAPMRSYTRRLRGNKRKHPQKKIT